MIDKESALAVFVMSQISALVEDSGGDFLEVEMDIEMEVELGERALALEEVVLELAVILLDLIQTIRRRVLSEHPAAHSLLLPISKPPFQQVPVREYEPSFSLFLILLLLLNQYSFLLSASAVPDSPLLR